MLDDLERGSGELKITMTGEAAFEVGENLAVSPGKVIFENELMQLVQYAPTTEQVHRRPLLIVPPWINKFYILDLKPKNSFIRFALDQGHTVFVISWVNPGPALAHKTFEDYLKDGPLAALEAIERAVGEPEATIIGYCLGGTLTACLLAYMASRSESGSRPRPSSPRMTDFGEPGELGVFIDDEQLALIEAHMKEKGYLEARHMQQVFNLMRANDLIWGFVVNNYLLGREPIAFDLLYWNADGTRMPYMMHSFYLRNMYQRNLLVQPGGITLLGVPIDLGMVKTPCYFLSTKDDHIAPWASTYRGRLHLRRPGRFVLGGRAHRRCHQPDRHPPSTAIGPTRDGRQPRRHGSPARQLSEGSWWPDWAPGWPKRVAPRCRRASPARVDCLPLRTRLGDTS